MRRNTADKRQGQLWKDGMKGIQVWEWKEQAEKKGEEGKEPNGQRIEKALMQAFYWKGLDGEARDLKTFPPFAQVSNVAGVFPVTAAQHFHVFSGSSEP